MEYISLESEQINQQNKPEQQKQCFAVFLAKTFDHWIERIGKS